MNVADAFWGGVAAFRGGLAIFSRGVEIFEGNVAIFWGAAAICGCFSGEVAISLAIFRGGLAIISVGIVFLVCGALHPHGDPAPEDCNPRP